jgi:membrane protein implicated in regulation of membrane protease activity
MALRRIGTMLQALASGTDPQAVRNDLPVGRGPVKAENNYNQVRTAHVMAIGPAVTVVQHQGQVAQVSQATDEPFRAGQEVYVAPVRGGGLVVLGSRRA